MLNFRSLRTQPSELRTYNDYFCNQLTELLTNYGEIFTVWFDGACGEGPNGKRQIYDWDRYYAVIRKLQPNACISICGPDVRWCGNEAGDTRPSEWSVLPVGFADPDEVAENSQKTNSTAFREKKIKETERDLGSREFLRGNTGLRWYPAETDTSIRPGWFYHAHEDEKVRSTETLLDLWYRTVGGNSTLLLNIPPDRRGLFHETDVQRLREMGEYIQRTFAENLAENKTPARHRLAEQQQNSAVAHLSGNRITGTQHCNSQTEDHRSRHGAVHDQFELFKKDEYGQPRIVTDQQQR